MKLNLNNSENERFYALQIENKEGKGWLKRNSNRTIIIETDADGILLGYHFETPAAEIAPPPVPEPQAKIRKEIRLYTKDELALIEKMFWSGVSVKDIAQELNRNYDSLKGYISRWKKNENIHLSPSQVAAVHKMLETCTNSESIAITTKLPLCLVKEVKREWAISLGESFGLNEAQVRLVRYMSSVYTTEQLKERAYKMQTLAAQVELSVDNLGAFLKLIR